MFEGEEGEGKEVNERNLEWWGVQEIEEYETKEQTNKGGMGKVQQRGAEVGGGGGRTLLLLMGGGELGKQ